jgi:hypothetical protein
VEAGLRGFQGRRRYSFRAGSHLKLTGRIVTTPTSRKRSPIRPVIKMDNASAPPSPRFELLSVMRKMEAYFLADSVRMAEKLGADG